jgi:hypothetical protein
MGRISFGFIESGYSDSHFGCGAQEDAPYDIEAARKAGLKAIALRCGGFPEETLRGSPQNDLGLGKRVFQSEQKREGQSSQTPAEEQCPSTGETFHQSRRILFF